MITDETALPICCKLIGHIMNKAGIHGALILGFFLGISALGAEEKTPVPGDFAGGLELAGESGTLLRFEIPERVYRRLERADRGDIRVFDAQGLMVPFAIYLPPEEIRRPPEEEIPFFLWNGGGDKRLPGTTDIEIDSAGGVIRIRNREGGNPSAPVYLADISLLDSPPAFLRVQMEEGRNFNVQVRVNYSADLKLWHSLEAVQVLARYGDSGLRRDSLELPGGDDLRYVLIRLEGEAPEPEKIWAGYGPRKIPGALRETIISGEISADRKRISYSPGGFLPLLSMDFILPEADSSPVVLKSRERPEEDWRVRARGTVYRFDAGGLARKNRAFEIQGPAPFWELESAGEIPFTAVPDCLIRWSAEELVFLARGKGPWRLVYGKAGMEAPAEKALFPPELGEIERALPTGNEWYTPRPLPEGGKDRRPWILWGVMAFAALALTFLAWRIGREIGNIEKSN